jgi:hypothetical protein
MNRMFIYTYIRSLDRCSELKKNDLRIHAYHHHIRKDIFLFDYIKHVDSFKAETRKKMIYLKKE